MGAPKINEQTLSQIGEQYRFAGGSLTRITPVLKDGNPDPARPAVWHGTARAQIDTGEGILPLDLSFALPGDKTLAEALDAAPAAIDQSLENFLREQSRPHIAVPGQRLIGG